MMPGPAGTCHDLVDERHDPAPHAGRRHAVGRFQVEHHLKVTGGRPHHIAEAVGLIHRAGVGVGEVVRPADEAGRLRIRPVGGECGSV